MHKQLYQVLKPYLIALLGAGLAYLERYFDLADQVVGAFRG